MMLTAAEPLAAVSHMLANKLFPLLTKSEVQEVILLSGKPPCAVVNGSYRRLSAQVLQEEDIMAVLTAAQGQEHASQLLDGAQWDFAAPGVGKVTVHARYDGPSLRVSLKLAHSGHNLLAAREVPHMAEDPELDAIHDSRREAPAQGRARKGAAHSGEHPGLASAREPQGRARSSGSSQNIRAQPKEIAQALDLASLAPAARLKAPQQRARDAHNAPPQVELDAFDPSMRDDLDALSHEAPAPVPRAAHAAREAPARAGHAQPPRDARDVRSHDEASSPSRGGRGALAHDEPGPASRGGRGALAHDEPNPVSRVGRGLQSHDDLAGLHEEPDAFAPEPAAPSARRGHDLNALDAPPAPQPRAAAPVKPTRPRKPTSSDALDVLFDRARQLHASDLHVLADRPAMLRIAGELVPQPEVFDPQTLEQLLLPRIPAGARATLDRDGSCDFALMHPEHGRFRANVGRQRTGLKLTARPIGEVAGSLAELGLPTSIAGALEHHQGLIVITGPTGHGKTTTMAALVGILNRETSHHVITVEDPIEYVHPTAQAVISQREVGSHTKSFAAALKGALREDPDVIVVGELRDTETVRMALSASETGHLVISTMNTPSAAKAIERLIDLFPPGDQPQVRMTLAGGLRLIISQRLVPSTDRKQLVAACEVLPGSTPLWALIRENRTFQIASLQQRGRSIGIIRLDDSLADLVKAGKTSLEIAREYADSTELLNTLIQGKPQPVRAEQQTPDNQNDPDNSLQKRGVELGKQVLSRAGKLFGGENK